MMKNNCRKIFAFIMVCTLAFGGVAPAWANSATDEVGNATTLYQRYVENGIKESQKIQTSVAGESPEAENYLGRVLDLTTRLVPFSYDATLGYTMHANPTTATVTFQNREWNDLNETVQATVEKIVAKASETAKNDYQMLQWFNNYIVDNCEYDTVAMSDPDRFRISFTAYGCLVEGKAVCEGYTNSMMLLCQKAGIPCIKVTGQANGGNHIWNAVYLNDKWWMLDVTFNDPVGEQSSTDRWNYFLIDMDMLQSMELHSFSEEYYLLSKQIYTGATVGQHEVTLPYAGLSTADARRGDVAYPQSAPTDNLNQENINPTHASHPDNLTLEDKANLLKEQGLFMGDERGFRLDEPMTRVEMGVMVMRMNHGQKELAAASQFYADNCPFRDVPQWAKSTIGYLYAKHLSAGISETAFGTGNVTKQDYAVMMLRVLKVEHTYADALQIAQDRALLTEEMAAGDKTATRGDIVYMTFATLEQINSVAIPQP